MRRLPAMLVITALCGTVVSLGTLSTLRRDGPVRDARRAIHPLPGLAPSQAEAQEVMEFKPVPPESVSTLLKTVVRPRAAAPGPVPAAPVPGTPAVPPAPALPPLPDAAPDQSGDVVRFGSNILIRAGETVVGDVVAMGGDVTVDGHVEGDVVALGGDVLLGPAGRVDGQVVTLGGQLHEQPGSHVGGQRVTAGGLPRGWGGWPFLGFLGMVGSGLKAAWAIAKMAVLLLVAWGFTQLAPNRTLSAYEAFKREPLMCLGLGLLAWALIIPSIVALALVVAILCITIIGIPLALAVLLGYVLTLLLLAVWGYVVGTAVLGERLARQLGRPAPSLTLMAVWGIVALTAIRVVGHLFGGIPMGGAAGGMLVVLSTVLAGVLVTIGAGALLRTQARRDVLGRWWTGARTAPTPAPAGGASPPGPGATPPPPPPPPVSPGSYGPPIPGGDPSASQPPGPGA